MENKSIAWIERSSNKNEDIRNAHYDDNGDNRMVVGYNVFLENIDQIIGTISVGKVPVQTASGLILPPAIAFKFHISNRNITLREDITKNTYRTLDDLTKALYDSVSINPDFATKIIGDSQRYVEAGELKINVLDSNLDLVIKDLLIKAVHENSERVDGKLDVLEIEDVDTDNRVSNKLDAVKTNTEFFKNLENFLRDLFSIYDGIEGDTLKLHLLLFDKFEFKIPIKLGDFVKSVIQVSKIFDVDKMTTGLF